MNFRRTESFSSLNTYAQCPKKYKLKYIDKREENKDTEALAHGREVHDKISKGIVDSEETQRAAAVKGQSYPSRFSARLRYSDSFFKPVRVSQKKQGIIELTEESFSLVLDSEYSWVPSDFGDPKALFQGVIDYARIEINKEKFKDSLLEEGEDLYLMDFVDKVYLYDWKTGKKRSERRQLNYYSLYFFALFPTLREVVCQNIFVTQTQVSPRWTVKREQVEEISKKLIDSVHEVNKTEHFPAKQTPLCSWCPWQEECWQELEAPKDALIKQSSLGLFI